MLHIAPARSEGRPNHGVKDPVSGLSHFAGLVVAIVAVSFLLGYIYARGDRAMLAMTGAYGLSLIALYASSSVYHLVPAAAHVTRWLRLVDHSSIYLLIAGTCTPVFHRAFQGALHTTMLAVIWGLAAIGIALKVAWRGAPRLLYTSIYVAMGWLAVVRWSDVVHGLPRLALGLVVAGGITYTLGAVVYATKRPDPKPNVFGFHEIWHLFVLGGSALHFAAVAVLAR
jgi:hemolysin III